MEKNEVCFESEWTFTELITCGQNVDQLATRNSLSTLKHDALELILEHVFEMESTERK